MDDATRAAAGESVGDLPTHAGDPPPPTASLPPAAAPPGYALGPELGRGGMGVVYHATQTALGRPVALKMILSGDHANAKERVRFLAEAEAMAAVRHPHVVQVYDFGTAAGRPFLALEHLPGGSLAAKLRAGPLAPAAAAVLVEKLAAGVQAAHDLGIVHRDLKPANVLLDVVGEPKITDFGLAKRSGGGDLTATHAVMGTPAYMAPEQARGDAKFVGPAADVYALGAILFECLAGRPPFVADDPVKLLLKVADQDAPAVSTLAAVPRDLSLVVGRCLEKEPAARYPSAAALADDLRRFRAGEPVSVRAAGRLERGLRWVRRNPARATAYALTVASLTLVGFGGVLAAAWRKAERARIEAVASGEQLAAEQRQTEAARAELAAAVGDLRQVEYARGVQTAYQCWRDDDTASGRRILAALPDRADGWEAGFVRRLLHPERWVFDHPPSPTFNPEGFAVSPDGRTVGVGSFDGRRVRLWDLAAGGRRDDRTLTLPADEAVGFVKLSPDMAHLATVDVGGEEVVENVTGVRGDDGRPVTRAVLPRPTRVRVWRLADGRAVITARGLFTAGVPSTYGRLDFSPDGSRVVAATADGVRVWDVRTAAPLAHLGPADAVRAVLFNGAGTRVLVDARPRLSVRDAATGREAWGWEPGGEYDAVAVDHAGERVAVGDGRQVRVWDALTAAETRLGHDRLGPPGCLAFAPDGETLAAGDGYAVRLFGLRDRQPRQEWRGHVGPVVGVRFTPDGRSVVSQGYGVETAVRVWDVGRPADARTAVPGAAIELSRDGTRVLVQRADGGADVRDAATGRLVWAVPEQPGATAGNSLTFGRTADEVLAADVRAAGQSPGLRRWTPGGPAGPAVPVPGLAVLLYHHPTADRVLVGLNRDGKEVMAEVDPATGRDVRVLPRLRNAVYAADGRIASSTTGDLPLSPRVQATDSYSHAHAGAVVLPDGTAVPLPVRQPNTLAFSPDGRRVALGCDWGEVAEFDADTGRKLWERSPHTRTVLFIGYSPDGRRLVTGGADRSVRVLDAATGHELLCLRGFAGPVRMVGFAAGGRRLVASDDDGVKLFDAD